MATKKVEVKQQATTTVDQLPPGDDINDSDAFLVSQGEGARATKKITGAQLKKIAKAYTLPVASKDDLGGVMVGDNLTIDEEGKLSAKAGIPGPPGPSGPPGPPGPPGPALRQFFKITGDIAEWTLPTDATFATVLINTSTKDFFQIRIPAHDYEIGTEIELVTYTETTDVHILSDFFVIVKCPTGNTLPKNGKARLIYTGKEDRVHVWVLRGDNPPTYVSGPYIRSITASSDGSCLPGTAYVRADLSDMPLDYLMTYRVIDPVTRIPSSSPLLGKTWAYEFKDLKQNYEYLFDVGYWTPDGKKFIMNGPKVSFTTQGTTARIDSITAAPSDSRGALHVFDIGADACPVITAVQWAFPDDYPKWVDGIKDPVTNKWAILASPVNYKKDMDLIFRAGVGGTFTDQKFKQFYPILRDISIERLRVEVNAAAKSVKVLWDNPQIKIVDDQCKWAFIVQEFGSDGAPISDAKTIESAWNTDQIDYAVLARGQGEVEVRIEAFKRTYGYDCPSEKVTARVDSGPSVGLVVKSITADANSKEIIVEFGGVDAAVFNIYAQLSTTPDMANPIVLHDSNKKFVDKVFLSAASLPFGTYYARAAAFQGAEQASGWLPSTPIKLVYEGDFRLIEGRAFLATKSVQVRVEPINLDTDRVYVHVSYTPDFSSYKSVTGGDLKDGWFVFNGTGLVDQPLYLKAARWRDGQGIDTPYVPDGGLLVNWKRD